MRRTQVAYVDDTDFFSNGENYEAMIQAIIDMYVKMYEATGARIQEEKVQFYCWQYVMIAGRRVCKQIEATIKVHGKKISQISIKRSTRTLGVYVTPTLSWKTNFEKVRGKVVDAMGKLSNTELTY